jgi:hypothetical protein
VVRDDYREHRFDRRFDRRDEWLDNRGAWNYGR